MSSEAAAPPARPPPVPAPASLREDAPLRAGGGGGGAGGGGGGARGPRLIAAAFAALSAAVTLALLTQVYAGDYEVVPHGAVSSSAAACSRAGTDALKAGGRAPDAAAAAALCLAVLAPHAAALDASGALVYWEYRSSRTQAPLAAEWGGPGDGPGDGPDAGSEAARPPRLLAALAALHAKLGVLPWARLLQPAITLAREGVPASEGLAGPRRPALALYLERLQQNTSVELAAAWRAWAPRWRPARAWAAGGRRAWAAGAGAARALNALRDALPDDNPHYDEHQTFYRVISSLREQAASNATSPAGAASGLAVVDRADTYLAMVTGTSSAAGGAPAPAPAPADGWAPDERAARLDLAPALLLRGGVCGSRFVVGAESGAALAQAAAALLAPGGAAAAVERPRLTLLPGGALAREAARPAPELDALGLAPAVNASPPYAAVNVVAQHADALQSHADSRGGGLASRF